MPYRRAEPALVLWQASRQRAGRLARRARRPVAASEQPGRDTRTPCRTTRCATRFRA